MELLIEVAGRSSEVVSPHFSGASVVEVEGLESAERLARPLYLDIHVRLQTQEEPQPQPEVEDRLVGESQEGLTEAAPAPAGTTVSETAVPAPGSPAQEARPELEGAAPVEEAPAGEGAVVLPAAAEAVAADLEAAAVVAQPAESMPAFQARVASAEQGLEQPAVAADTASLRRAGASGAGTLRRSRRRIDPRRVLEPRPVPPEPPAPTPEDPVPHALWLVDHESEHRLEDQTPPALSPSPQANMPRLGDQALAPDAFSTVIAMGREFERRTEEVSSEDPWLQVCRETTQTEMSVPPLSPQEQHVLDLYRRLRNPPPIEERVVPEKFHAEPEPRLVPPLRRAEPTDVARVFSYLLAQPEETARAALRDARGAIAPGDAVNEHFPVLGDDRLPGLQADLDRQFRDMATQAGASAAQLDQAIENRRNQLREEELRAQQSIDACWLETTQSVMDESAFTGAAIQNGAQSMTGHAQSIADAAAAEPVSPVDATSERLLSTLRRHAGGYTAYYRRMGDTRRSTLDRAQQAYISAYTFAEQRDELAIGDRTDLTPQARQEQLRGSQAWLAVMRNLVTLLFETMRVQARTAIAGFNRSVEQAAASGAEEIRDWAAAESGQSRDFEQQLEDSVSDWNAQTQANADAWQAVENGRQAAVANQYIDLYAGLRATENDEAHHQAILGDQRLRDDQRLIAAAYFRSLEGATGPGNDPIAMIADGIRQRFMEGRRNQLAPALRTEMIANGAWRPLGLVGSAIGPGADIEARARKIYGEGLHGGITGWNEVDKVMDGLAGLNDVQVAALRKAYLDIFEISLDADLERELKDHEWTRARSLLEAGVARSEEAQQRAAVAAARTDEERQAAQAGLAAATERRNRAEALTIVAQLYAAGQGRVGTDEPTIFRLLRSITDESQRQLVRDLYQSEYGRPLDQVLREELNDWATSTTHDQERGLALLEGNRERADAIAIDEAMYYRFWGASRGDVEQVYTGVRDEVRQQAMREGRSSEWVRVELERRVGLVESNYNDRFRGTMVLGREHYAAEGAPQQLYLRGSLRENYTNLFGATDSGILTALADNDPAAADAARIRAERRGFFYSSDSTINEVLLSQAQRARQDEELDTGTALRYLEQQRMDSEEEAYFRRTGSFWTPDMRFRRQQELELSVDRAIDRRSETRAGEYMQRLASTYQRQYHGETLETVVSENVSGQSREAARALIDRGYLTPYERLRYGIEGAGTEEDLVKNTLRGRSAEEIAELDRLWQRDHPGETLLQAVEGDLSGDDLIDARISLMGRPMTIDDAVSVAEAREFLNRPGGAGPVNFASENRMVGASLDELRRLRDQIRSPRSALLPREEQRALLEVFNGQRAAVEEAVEARNAIVSSVTDSIVNAVSIASALVAGAVLSFFTFGIAGAVMLAVFASVMATTSSIVLRAALMQNRYGTEQMGVDIAVGVVDAIVAGLTAGMGGRLLGKAVAAAAERAAAETGKAAERSILASLRQALGRQLGPLAQRTQAIGFLEKMAQEEAAWYSRVAAEGISQVIENTVQGMPSAFLSAALDEENYKHGNFFLNIVGGAGQQLAMGVAQGMAFSAGQGLAKKAGSFAVRMVRGPELGTGTYRRGPQRLSPREFESQYRDYEQMHRGASREQFEGVLTERQARVEERSRAQAEQRSRLREELDAELRSHPDEAVRAAAGRLDDVPITRLGAADYARVAGIGAPDVTLVEHGGQMHIVVREGASPAAIREHAAALAARVEPGTGGRVRDPSAALPRDLRDAVPVLVNPRLPPRQVEVHYWPLVYIVAGPGATAADIRLHARTARAQLSLQGARGRVARMLERIRLWRLEHGTPPQGSRAFEAHYEVEKLPEIIRARQAELANPDLSPHQRAQLELAVVSLHEQLDLHAQRLAEFEIPGRGFIAAEPHELQRPYKEAVRGEVERYARTPIEPGTARHSPLHGKEIDIQGAPAHVEAVNQVGETWHEWGRVDGEWKFLRYRLVEGLDINNRRIALYEENLSKEGNWVMRGEEISEKGRLGERASRIQMQTSIRGARARGRPDFLVEAQTASGQGFDKVRVKFGAGDLVRTPEGVRLSEHAAPTLVIGEDKLMGQVTYEKITAIRTNLIENLRRLQRQVDSGLATLPRKEGGLGLTPFQAEALGAALREGNFRFELRVFAESALGNPTSKSDLQQARMIVPRLREEIPRLLKSDWPGTVRSADVERVVIQEGYLKRARESIDIDNRIGVVPDVYRRAREMGLQTNNPDHLHRAFVSLLAQSADQPGQWRLRNPKYDPDTGLVFDSGGAGGRAIHSSHIQDSGVRTTSQCSQFAERLLGDLMTRPKSPGGTLADPIVILDLSGVSAGRREALRRELARLFAGRHQQARLDSILVFTDQDPRLQPLVPAAEVPGLLSPGGKRRAK